jgi:hypothetical protein
MSWEPMAAMMPIVVCPGIFVAAIDFFRIQGTNSEATSPDPSPRPLSMTRRASFSVECLVEFI